MELEEARKILYKYIPENEIKDFYRKNGLDNSGTDTTRRFQICANYLRQKAIMDSTSDNERKECLQAANVFEKKYNTDFGLA